MTATDELRRLLDERGVEWRGHGTTDRTWYEVGRVSWFIYERENKNLTADAVFLTPEQAIAATLGAGTCKNVHEPPRNTTFWPTPHFKCSECGATHVSMDYVYYCPNCGRRVVE